MHFASCLHVRGPLVDHFSSSLFLNSSTGLIICGLISVLDVHRGYDDNHADVFGESTDCLYAQASDSLNHL